MPAVKAGMREDDRMVAMDGKPLGSIAAMIDQLQETKEKPVDVTVLRGNANSELSPAACTRPKRRCRNSSAIAWDS